MKRPVLVAVIGYIIGIIIGLYFEFSIVFFYVLVALITVFIRIIKVFKYKIIFSPKESIIDLFRAKKLIKNQKKKFSFYSMSRYLRYFKLIINRKVIITIIVFSCISNFIIIEKNKMFNSFYNIKTDVEITAKVVEKFKEKEYKNIYKIKVIELNRYNKEVDLILNVNKNQELEFGDIIKINGEYKAPQGARNYGGFSYRDYLKTQNIYGTVNAKSVKVINKSGKNDIGFLINNVKERIKTNAKKYLDDETYSIFLGLMLGDTSFIEEETIETFRNSNMSHILAVSGMHITYIVIGIVMLLTKVSGKKLAKIFSIIVLIFYITITGFAPSIIRACITAIILLIGGIINRKADAWTSIAISVFIILIYNPYLITNIGFQFSYMGTLGILIFSKTILKILTHNKYKNKYRASKIDIFRRKIKEQKVILFIKSKKEKINNKLFKNDKRIKQHSKIKELIAVSISVQIFIIPLTIYHFNTIGIYFLITNILLSLIIAPVMIIGFISLIMILFDFVFSSIFIIPLKIGIKIILLISNVGNLPFSKIYIKTPRMHELMLYYLILIILNFIYLNVFTKTPTNSNLRVQYMLHLFKYNYRKYKKKVITALTIIILVISTTIILIPKSLKIHFVDVGQGDCCFIETPQNKTILIDGGGSEFGNFDVGKSILLPYVLDKGYTRIDYIISSHMDQDHIGGLLTIIQELEVKNIVISRQGEPSSNYERFVEIVKNKKINVSVLGNGDKLRIENDLYFDFLWPKNKELIRENTLNNNSIVCKMNYKEFSMLFTGDIEEIAEKKILQEYRNNLEILNSTILKIAHHGSKTSSTQEFLEAVKPKIVLIGVGENNKFGHPNQEIIKRLQNFRCKNI